MNWYILYFAIFVLALINVKMCSSQVRTIKDLKEQLRQKDQALEAATWAICKSHKEDIKQ